MARQPNKNLDKIKELYPTIPDKELAEKFGVTEKYVRNVGGRYGLKKNYHWSEKEKKLILKYYEYGVAFVQAKLAEKEFPDRTKWAIINMYRELTGKR